MPCPSAYAVDMRIPGVTFPPGATGGSPASAIRCMRSDSSVHPYWTYTNATVSIGKTSVAPNSMSPTFAKNITQPMTTVLNATKLVLPAQPAPTTSPMAFNVNLSWTRPFIFLAGKDNLLLDMSLAGSQAKSSYFVDAEYTDTTSAVSTCSFGRILLIENSQS